MRIRAIATALVLAVAAPAAAEPCAPESQDPLSGLGDVIRSADPCAAATDADRAFDAQLASLDVGSLPDSLELEPLFKLDRALIAYLLERDLDTLGDSLSKAELATTRAGRAVLGGFALSRAKGGNGVDMRFLRKALDRLYHCSRAFPPTLEGFMSSRFAWNVGEGFVLDSKPKRGPRRLLGNRDGTVRIAETLNADGSVRETEIVLSGTRSDGALDFLVYDANGKLDGASEFPLPNGETRRLASPYVCMSCHLNPKTTKFDVVFPSRHP